MPAISCWNNRKHEVLWILDYLEDSSASVDMNIVMTTSGKFSENTSGTG